MTRQLSNQAQQQTATTSPLSSGILQRKCVSCGQHTIAGGECEGCQKKRSPLQRRSANQAEPAEVPPIVGEVLRSPGQPLDPVTRAFMEPRFGHDFSQVRIHTDAKAAKSAKAIRSLAYTMGQNVVFGEGQYSPNAATGKKLLAHELTHTLQQRHTVSPVPQRMEIGSANSLYEQEATQVADIVLSGKNHNRTHVKLSPSKIQRTCGAAVIGSVGGCTGREGDITQFGFSSDHLYLFQVGCDELQLGEEDRLREFARSIAPDETVEIDGFASEEGLPDFNENLSCARAHRAAEVISSAGVASRIELYKHGAMPGSREDRRSVVISTTSPALPTHVPPTPTTPPPQCTLPTDPGRTREESLRFAQSLDTCYPNWLNVLPDCPCTFAEARASSEFQHSTAHDLTLPFFHPGATNQVRSSRGYQSVPGTSHGQQCCYDANGRLITEGAGTGTPDLWSPNLYFNEHQTYDVAPFNRLGWRIYNQYWRPNPGRNCPANAGGGRRISSGRYRIVGTFDEIDLFIVSIPQREVSASENVQVMATGRTMPDQIGGRGHYTKIEVIPTNAAARDLFSGEQPRYVPDYILQPLD